MPQIYKLGYIVGLFLLFTDITNPELSECHHRPVSGWGSISQPLAKCLMTEQCHISAAQQHHPLMGRGLTYYCVKSIAVQGISQNIDGNQSNLKSQARVGGWNSKSSVIYLTVLSINLRTSFLLIINKWCEKHFSENKQGLGLYYYTHWF